MTALVASEDGRKVLRATGAEGTEGAERLGRRLAVSLLDQGASSIAPLQPGKSWRE